MFITCIKSCKKLIDSKYCLKTVETCHSTYVTWPAKINHLSAKNCRFLLSLLYHDLITIYTTATKSLSLLQNLMDLLLQLAEMGYLILNGRYWRKYNSV